MLWWILAIVAVFVVLVVVLQRRGAGSGDPNHVPGQQYGSGPSVPPGQWGGTDGGGM